MADLSGRKFGKYQLIEQLGRGGMADVYKAYQPGLDRYVAVKVMLSNLADSENFVTRFRREAQIVGQLRHPNIVQVIDFDIQDDVYYMVMEYIRGSTLKKFIQEEGQLPATDAFRICEQLADALAYAHQQGMIHRDIKPANVMFSDATTQHPILTDFGIARIMADAGLTASGAFIGTPAYMSPEIGRGEKVDERSDIYSLGVMFYEMLTGKVPFDADTPFAVMMKHISAPLPSPRQFDATLSETVERVILKSLSKDPADRYQTAGEMRDALRAARAQLAEEATMPPTAVKTRPSASQDKTILDDTRPSDEPTYVDTKVSLATPPPTPLPTAAGKAAVKKEAMPQAAARKFPPVWALGIIVVLIAIGGIIFALSSGGDDGDSEDKREATQQVAEQTSEATAPAEETSEPTAEALPTDEPTPPVEVAIATGDNRLVQPYLPDDDPAIIDFANELIVIDYTEGYDVALAAIEEKVAEYPDNPILLGLRSQYYLRGNRVDEARADADAAIAANLNHPAGYLALSIFHFNNENYDYVAGLEAAQAAYNLTPQQPQVNMAYARALRIMGRYDEALKHYQDAERYGMPVAEVLSERVRFLWDINWYLELIPEAERLLGLGEDAYIRLYLAGAYLQTDQSTEAVRVIDENTFEFNTDQLEFFSNAAYILFEAGETGRALEMANEAVLIDPDPTPGTAEYVLALIEADDSNYGPAIERLTSMESLETWQYTGVYLVPVFGRALPLDIARIYRNAGDTDNALAYYTLTIEQFDWWALPYQERATIYLEVGDTDAARDDLLYVLSIAEGTDDVALREEALSSLGEINPDIVAALTAGRFSAYTDEDDPEVVDLANHIERTQQEEGAQAALSLLEVSLPQYPDNPILLSLRSQLRLANQDYEGSKADADTVINTYPDHPAGYIARANYYANSPEYDYEQVFAALDTAFGLAPENAEINFAYAQALRNTGRFDEALTYYSNAEQFGYPLLEVLGERLYLYWQAGNWDGVIGDGERILNIIEYEETRLFLSSAYIALGQVDEAVRTLDESPEMVEPNDGFQSLAAFILLVSGDSDRARDIAQTLIDKQNEDPYPLTIAHYVLALIAIQEGDYEKALQDFEVVNAWLENNTLDTYLISPRFDVSPLLDQARLYRDTGNLEAALDFYSRAIANYDWWVILYVERAGVYVQLGDIEAARQDLISASDRESDEEFRQQIIDQLEALNAARVSDSNSYFTPYLAEDNPQVIDFANQVFAAYDAEGYDSAIDLLNRGLEEFPSDPTLLGYLSRLETYQGNYEAALQRADEAITANPNHPTGYLARAIYFSTGPQFDGEQARLAAQTALDLAPDHPEVNLIFARTVRYLGEYGEALQFYDRAGELGMPSLFVGSERQYFFWDFGNFDGIVAEAPAYLDEFPYHIEIRLMLAGSYLALDQFEQTIAVIEEAPSEAADDPYFYQHAAYLYYATGQPDRARELANRAFEDGLEGEAAAKAFYVLALLDVQTGEFIAAQEKFDVLSQFSPESYEWILMNYRLGHLLALDRARAYLAQDDITKAQVYFNTAIETASWWYLPYLERARLARQIGDLDAARQDFEEALNRAPNEAIRDEISAERDEMEADVSAILNDVYYEPYLPDDDPAVIDRANEIYFQDSETALAIVNESLAEQPDNPILLYAKSRILLFQIGNAPDAWTTAYAAVSRHPEHPAGYLGLALYYWTRGETTRALQDAETALNLAPNHPETNLIYGWMLRANGDYDNALAYFNRAEELGMNLLILLWERKNFFWDYGDYLGVIADTTRALTISENAVHRLYLAGAYLQLDQPEEALRVSLEAQYPQEDTFFYSQVIYIFYAAGDFDRARETAPFLLESEDEGARHRTHYVMGLLETQAGNYEAALASFRELSEVEAWEYEWIFLNPRFGHLLTLDIARAYFGLGDYTEALTYATQGVEQNPDWYLPYLERARIYIATEDRIPAILDLERALDRSPDEATTEEINALVAETRQ